jgi:hypothetical protein
MTFPFKLSTRVADVCISFTEKNEPSCHMMAQSMFNLKQKGKIIPQHRKINKNIFPDEILFAFRFQFDSA